ncbi:MAG TPA: hypothetical protein H9672_11750 [Firmicutes bacterium]|nr:hypothetical protein [Bacillota bacterium]
MKIQEFRDLLKGADRERLEKAFSECYKQFSKAKKEEIDDLVRDILSGGEENSRKKDTTADFAALEREVALFVENAYAQNYLVPNRSVSKSQRPKWRFLVMNSIKELNAIPPESEFFERAVQCLWELYGVLCQGCNVYLFSSDDPFASVRWKQPELFHLLVKKTFLLGYTEENIKKVVQASSTGGLSRTSLYVMNQMALLSELKTSDVKYIAIEAAKEQIETLRSQKTKSNRSSSDYYREEKINNLCGLVLLIYITLAEAGEGIQYFFSRCEETNKEFVLYEALDYAAWMEDEQVWIDFYHYGLKKKIKPRDSLRKKYEELMMKKICPLEEESV